jgi:curved DNA-binding protein CbpA
MAGFLGRLRGTPKLTASQRHDLLLHAMGLHSTGITPAELEDELQRGGASLDEARVIGAEALQKFEADLVRTTPLPTSARSGVNYYFLLGVTPAASAEQIHRAYRIKAKTAHPDQHYKDFTVESWSRLMTTLTDAHSVLTDSTTRRAYDVVWRKRSREIAAQNRRKGELRGDWETRYRWSLAEFAQQEEQIEMLLQQLHETMTAGGSGEALVNAVTTATEDYEGRLVDIRNQTYGLSEPYAWLAEQVRYETRRKEKFVAEMRRVEAWLPEARTAAGAQALAPRILKVLEALEQVRLGQQSFDLRAARDR